MHKVMPADTTIRLKPGPVGREAEMRRHCRQPGGGQIAAPVAAARPYGPTGAAPVRAATWQEPQTRHRRSGTRRGRGHDAVHPMARHRHGRSRHPASAPRVVRQQYRARRRPARSEPAVPARPTAAPAPRIATGVRRNSSHGHRRQITCPGHGDTRPAGSLALPHPPAPACGCESAGGLPLHQIRHFLPRRRCP